MRETKKKTPAGTEFYTIKRIDNSRLVRSIAPARMRECLRLVALGAMVTACALLYTWQHFQCIQMSYQLETLKTQQAEAHTLNQQLHLEVAGLRDPMRIDGIARRQLGLTAPVPGQIENLNAPSDAELAQVRPGQTPNRP
ncbi:MAG TPA: cell division protein FtsL [Candidatus Acidoferrales bacterium]|nr:cell division protein FtsL [Candidatus Acidoferrales bacterium]